MELTRKLLLLTVAGVLAVGFTACENEGAAAADEEVIEGVGVTEDGEYEEEGLGDEDAGVGEEDSE